MRRLFISTICTVMILTAFAQYPKKLAWNNAHIGNGVYFTIKAEIGEPSTGMQYVTYQFTNHSSSDLWLYWTTTLVLSNGSKIDNRHEWKFKGGQTVGMGWAHTESDVIDTKQKGGKITNVLINSIRAEIDRNENTKQQQKAEENLKRKEEEKEKQATAKKKSEEQAKIKVEEERLAAAELKREQDSINNEIRKQRVESVKKADDAENVAMAASAGAVVGIAALIEDHWTNKPSFAKFYLGLGLEHIPLIVNNDNNKVSTIDVSSHPIAQGSLKWGILNNKGISLHLSGSGSYGMNALTPGTNGLHWSYGGTATLLLGASANARFKLFGEAQELIRGGEYNYDSDAANASIGFSSDYSIIRNASYSYQVDRFGGGIQLNWINEAERKESYLRLGAFIEKFNDSNRHFEISYEDGLLLSAQILFSSYLLLDVNYSLSKDYYKGGAIEYPNNFTNDSKQYFSIRLFKTGWIF